MPSDVSEEARMLRELQETAEGLNREGALSETDMARIRALCKASAGDASIDTSKASTAKPGTGGQ